MITSEFLRRNWLGLLGLVVGVFGITLSFLFYVESQVIRDPVFLVDPERTEIIRADRVTSAPIKVVRQNGQEIAGDICSVRLYFWNRGRMSIRRENILQPLRILLDEPKGEILDSKVLRCSRSVVNPSVTSSTKNPLHEVILSFDILEQGDGIALQIIFMGETQARLLLEGTIEGVGTSIDDKSLRQVQFWKEYGRSLMVLVVLGCFFLAINVLPWAFKQVEKLFGQELSRYLRFVGTGILYVILVGFLFLFCWAFIVAPIYEAKKKAGQSVTEMVPTCLR